jgi:hypothetical protein
MAQKTEETKELTKVESSQLPALPAPDVLREVFEANFEGVSPSFAVIKMPTGGVTRWVMPSEDGEEQDMVKELVGVVLDHYPVRAYWPEEFGGGNTPPTCASLDAKTGSLPREGTMYGDCATCVFAQWGSGREGRGQKCKKIHRVYLWLAGNDSIFPHLIPLPPTSAEGKYEGSFSTYAVKLGGKLKKITDVKTKVKLIEDKNKDGIKYAKAQFFMAGELTEQEKKNALWLRDNLRPAMRSKPFEMEETEVHEDKSSAASGTDPWDK